MNDGAQGRTAIDPVHDSHAHRLSEAGPLIAFGVLAAIWGYNWVVMKLALSYSGPIEFALLRVGLAVLVMFTLLAALRIPLKPPAAIGKTIWLGLFQTTGFIGLMSWSLSFGAVGKSAVLAYTMPFWVIVLGWPFLQERLQGRQWPAVGLALVGLLLVLELWAPAGSLASSLVALGAGAAWGISVIIAKKIPVRGRDELLSLTAWQMLFGFVPLVPAALLAAEPPIEWSGYFIGALIFNAAGATAIAMLLWLYILQRLPATVSGLSSLLVPVIGVAAAWLQLGERPDLFEGVGMALILAALALHASARRLSAPQ
jgi:drug/metabolite transporter (DMT)-like permease